MKHRTRIYYSDAQKAVMWERWKQGWTLHQIAQLFNRAHTSVQGILAKTGGIRPPARTRAATALTLAEREEISRATAEGHSIRSIASRLGRAASTVSRELSGSLSVEDHHIWPVAAGNVRRHRQGFEVGRESNLAGVCDRPGHLVGDQQGVRVHALG
jgi:hypothetical protein